MSSLTRNVSARAMHMYISPRPSNLGESREIMRLLSQFGEIEYYKNLKYEQQFQPRSATVIYREESAAEECLKRSPIRFRMGKATGLKQEVDSPEPQSTLSIAEAENNELHRGPMGAPFGLGTQSRSMSTSHNALPRPPRSNNRGLMPFESHPDPHPQIDPDSRIFEIVVNRSSRNYRDRANHGHYHHNFNIDSKMVGQGDLMQKVPTPGLSCIDFKHMDKPWHLLRSAREYEYSGNMVKARRRLGVLWAESGHADQVAVEQDQDQRAEEPIESGLDGSGNGYQPFFGT